jgi:hypothetical protein
MTMLLTKEDVELFGRLQALLYQFVNKVLRIFSPKKTTPQNFAKLTPLQRLKLRDALLDNMDLLEDYLEQNPDQLSADDLAIIAGWSNYLEGEFVILRETEDHTQFLLIDMEQPEVFGVLAHAIPFREMLRQPLPARVSAVLLPFKGAIIYDTFLLATEDSPTDRQEYGSVALEIAERIIEMHGVTLTLDEEDIFNDEELPLEIYAPFLERPKEHKYSGSLQSSPVTGNKATSLLRNVVAEIEDFSRQYLDQDYLVLCRAAAEQLAVVNSELFTSGKEKSLACGIVRAIGSVNFLSDKSFAPSMPLKEVGTKLGISPSTASKYQKLVEENLGIDRFDFHWMLPRLIDDHPAVWMLMVNGMMMDIRDLPRDAQAQAFEQGIIPYIPADR